MPLVARLVSALGRARGWERPAGGEVFMPVSLGFASRLWHWGRRVRGRGDRGWGFRDEWRGEREGEREGAGSGGVLWDEGAAGGG